MATRPLSEVWCLAIQDGHPQMLFSGSPFQSRGMHRIPARSLWTFGRRSRLDPMLVLSGLRIDATPPSCRRRSRSVQGFEQTEATTSVLEALMGHFMARYKEAMAAVLKDDSGAAVEDRVEVESLWVEDAIS